MVVSVKATLLFSILALVLCILHCCCCLVTKSCPTLCDPVDYSPPGSSVHDILQAGILEWVAMLFSRGSSWPGDGTWVSCFAGRVFTAEPPGKPCTFSLYEIVPAVISMTTVLPSRLQTPHQHQTGGSKIATVPLCTPNLQYLLLSLIGHTAL